MQRRAIRLSGFPFDDSERLSSAPAVQAAEMVWLSGQRAPRFDFDTDRRRMVEVMRVQVAAAHTRQRLLLEAAGLGLSNVVKLTDYITPAGREPYVDLMAEREALYGSAPPAISPVIVTALVSPNELIETEMVATSAPLRRIGAGHGLGTMSGQAAVQAGDLLFCSAMLPLDAQGRLVSGGLIAQTEQIYKNAVVLLAGAGYTMQEVVRTVDFLDAAALAGYRDTGRVRAAYLGAPGSVGVAATGILMPELVMPGALIQIDFSACHGPKQILNPGWERYRRLTYAPAVRAGTHVFLSGQLALHPETNDLQFAGDVAGQARAIYGNIAETLAVGGLASEHVVKTIEYVTPAGLEEYRAVDGVRKEFFSEPYPAVTAVVCERLLRPGALIEVECLAVAG